MQRPAVLAAALVAFSSCPIFAAVKEEMFREQGIQRTSHAPLEEETRAREERASAADRKPIGPRTRSTTRA